MYIKKIKNSFFKKRLLFFAIAPLLITNVCFASKTLRIFHIENTLITSKAVYSIKLSDNYEIIDPSPIYNYWLRPNGSTRPVNWFENQIAYGLKYHKVTNKNTIEFALSKYSSITIIAHIKDKKLIPYFIFKKKKYTLEKMRVKAKEGVFFPSVEYVEVIGYSIASKQKVVKRITDWGDDTDFID